MANKMISDKDLHDSFLSDLIRSEPLESAPDHFCDEVMSQINQLPSLAKVAPYTPPRWLKWGIPGILSACIVFLIIFGIQNNPEGSHTGIDLNNQTINTISNWMSKAPVTLDFPVVQVPNSTAWILLGIMALFWSFYLLNFLLTKKTHQKATR